MKAFLLALAFLAVALRAQPAREYQIAGTVVALTERVVTIEKAGEKWEIDRSAGPRIEGDVALGRRVTIRYRMAATSIDGRPDSPATEAALSRAEQAAKKADEAAERTRQKARP